MASRRSSLKRNLTRLIIGVSLLLALCIGLVVFRDPLLRAWVERRLVRTTGFNASVEQLRTDLVEGRLEVKGVRLFNPPQFGNDVMLDLPELSFQVDPEGSVSNRWRLRQAVLNLAALNLVRDTNGVLNLDTLLEHVEKYGRKPSDKKKEPHSDTGPQFDGIDELRLTLGTVRFMDLRHPQSRHELRLGVEDEVLRNVRSAEDLKRWYYARLFRVLLQAVLTGPKDGDLLDLLVRLAQ